MDDISEWTGRRTSARQTIEKWPLEGLASLIDAESGRPAADAAGVVHPCAHWLYFVPSVAQSDIDADGHPRRGGFIPPLKQPRRMWAASAISYHDDMRVGDEIEKTSIIRKLESKKGKSGELVFLEIGNQYTRDGCLLREERQTLVYRDHQDYDDALFTARAEDAPGWSRRIQLGAVELFRYSAVTFNGHRIHYDGDYTRDVEGYPAIIVQGQFIATLLLSHALAATGAARCRRFSFKAVKPVFCDQPFFVEGCKQDDGSLRAWARQEDGRINMTAEIEV